jgi:serine/threonine-protein kinase
MSERAGTGRTFGSYEVLEELGRGGMGRVYRARHVTLQRDVALKVLAEGFAENELFVQRFLKEARAAACLNHPNIVQIYDFGQEGPEWFLAMEYVEGRSLSYFLKSLGRFSEKDVVTLARQALTALSVAHGAGIVHRDIKPDNLILGAKGIVKLVDLGLAKRVDDPGASTTGFAAGTPLYISPEQIEGRPDVDGRADLYSLGATLFHLATGKVPFPGPTSAIILMRHMHERAPDPRTLVPELSAGFSAAVLRLLARERERRPPTAEDADREFAQLQEASPQTSTAVLPRIELPAGSGPPRGGDAPGWDSSFCLHLESRLAARVGPLAGLLVRRATAETDDLEELCRRLAAQIPDENARPAFLREVMSASSSSASRPSRPGSGLGTPFPPPPASSSLPGSVTPGRDSPSGPAAFASDLLVSAERRLAAEIGPLARVLVKRESRRQATWSAFVEALATHVPEEAGRRRLREALGPLGV